MSSEYFTFHEGGHKTGGIIRTVGEDYLCMVVAFGAEGGEPYHCKQCTQFSGGDIREWSTYTYDSGSDQVRVNGKRTHDGIIMIDTIAYPEMGDALPSYASNLLLLDFLRSDVPSLTYREFADADPADVVDATFERCGRETVNTPYGVQSGTKITLNRGGVVANTYWCDDDRVLVCDWQGAQSYRVDDLDTLLVGLEPKVASTLQEFDRSGDPAGV